MYNCVKLGTLTRIRTGKLDANASSTDGAYPFFTCSREVLRIATYSYDCECVLVAGNGVLNVKYYASPALAAASYPFVDLPSGDTLRCKLFPADKFHKICYLFRR